MFTCKFLKVIALTVGLCLTASSALWAAAPGIVHLSNRQYKLISGYAEAAFKEDQQKWTSVGEYYHAFATRHHDDNAMRNALRARFQYNANARAHLLATGDDTILADEMPSSVNPALAFVYEDCYWAYKGSGLGQNRFGQLLMEIRDELRQQVAAQQPTPARGSSVIRRGDIYDENIPNLAFTSRAGYTLAIRTNPLSVAVPQIAPNTHRGIANIILYVDGDDPKIQDRRAWQAAQASSLRIKDFLNQSLGRSEGTTEDGIQIMWQVPNSILTNIGIRPNVPHNRSCHISLADAGFIDQMRIDQITPVLRFAEDQIDENLPCSASYDRIQVFITRDKPMGGWRAMVHGKDRIIIGLGVKTTDCLNTLATLYKSALGDTKPFEPHTTIVMLQEVPHERTSGIMNNLIDYFTHSPLPWYDASTFTGHQSMFNAGKRSNEVINRQ